MDLNLRKEKSLVQRSHTKQQDILKSTPTESLKSSPSSFHVNLNKTSFLHSEERKWNSDSTEMWRKRNFASQDNSLTSSDTPKAGSNEKHTKIWKRRNRTNTKKDTLLSSISEAFSSQVIFPKSSYTFNIIIYLHTLLFILSGAQSQSAFTGGSSAIGTIASNRLDHRESAGPEGFFFATNGSSSAILSDTLLTETSSGYFGLSFRTCTPGQLLKQVGDNLDVLEVELSPEDGGTLHFSLKAQQGEYLITRSIGSKLLDANWHTVLFQVSPQNDKITINISGTQEINSISGAAASSVNGDSVIISSEDVRDALRVLDLSRGTSPQLHVGAGFIGCIREGPKVRFTKVGISVNSHYVKWGRGGNCLLPNTCEGKTFV